MFDVPIYWNILFYLCIGGGVVCVPLTFIVVGALSLRERAAHLKSVRALVDEPTDNYAFVLILIGVLSLGCVIFGLWSMSR
jgi:hypothetical protein